jgi:RHS repeat-associated protein
LRRGGSPNVFIDIGRAYYVLGVKNLAILAQIDTQKLQMSDTLRIFEEFVGAKNYELSNHLGNVLATISDKTIFNTDHYNGIVYSAQLYYPFGWEIPTLSYSAKKYRFGFNGKEDDREWHAQDYGFRLYTPREGRFIGVDPITAEYPELTPYQFASNTPIAAVDLDGLEAAIQTSIENYHMRIGALPFPKGLEFLYPGPPEYYRMMELAEKMPSFEQEWLNSHTNSNRVKRNESFHKAKGFFGQALASGHLDSREYLDVGYGFYKTTYVEGLSEKIDYVNFIDFIPNEEYSAGIYNITLRDQFNQPIFLKHKIEFGTRGVVEAFEVKTSSVTTEKYFIEKTITDGCQKMIGFATKNKGIIGKKGQQPYDIIPVLAVDKDAWEKALPLSRETEDAVRELTKMGGGVYPIPGLAKDAEKLTRDIKPTLPKP